MRPYIAVMTLFTAVIGAFEALLFGMLGQRRRLARRRCAPAQLWAEQAARCCCWPACWPAASLLVALQSLLKQQTLAGNFPMRLRWNFHRLMLAQSMGFYQDEFAGRIATKVMQTALAVRDTVMIVTDILVFVVIYFVTMVAVVGGFDAWMLAALPRLAGAVRRGAVSTSCRAWARWRRRRPMRAR